MERRAQNGYPLFCSLGRRALVCGSTRPTQRTLQAGGEAREKDLLARGRGVREPRAKVMVAVRARRKKGNTYRGERRDRTHNERHASNVLFEGEGTFPSIPSIPHPKTAAAAPGPAAPMWCRPPAAQLSGCGQRREGRREEMGRGAHLARGAARTGAAA